MAAPASRVLHKPNPLVVFWFGVSSLIVFWDLAYLFARPHSFKALDGKFAHLWPGYELYETIDRVYSISSWEKKLGFPPAQATMNVVENFFNFTYLWLAHSSSESKRAIAPVVGFAGVVMTCSKTVLYMLCDYYCGFCESATNDWRRWLLLYIAPNGTWIVVPALLSVYFGFTIAKSLKHAAGIPVANGPPAASTRSKTKAL